MPSYKNFNSDSKFIPKVLLNKNRVLTMSNNRKCNYLIVDVGNTEGDSKDVTTMMAINNQGNTKDILVVKTFTNKKSKELVDEAYWLCCEFGINTILADNIGLGLGFIEAFQENIDSDNINIIPLDGIKISKFINIRDIIDDLNNGKLRFLQTPELAKNTYIKPFLGLSNIIEYHKETDKLIDEINNLEVKLRLGNIILDRLKNTIGKSRVNCLLMFYSYPMSMVDKVEIFNDDIEQYDEIKRIEKYNIIHGTFYKYLFKCIENENINVLFYYNNKNKVTQFQNMIDEEQFNNLIKKHVSRINMSKDYFEIRFNNDSSIRFVYGRDNARGYRCHFAVVDTEIDREIYNNVICGKTILFDMVKRDGMDSRLKDDNYCVDYIEM